MIALKRSAQGSFTVRKISFGQGVERIFPFNAKVIDKVEKIPFRQGPPRAKLFYLRGLPWQGSPPQGSRPCRIVLVLLARDIHNSRRPR